MNNEQNMNNSDAICRICLQDGATYPIFENYDQDIRSKISLCLHVTIDDIEGYPRVICKNCNETLDVLYNFINKFKENCEILQNGLLNVKQEEISLESSIFPEEDETDFEYECVDHLDDLKIIGVKNEPTIDLKPPNNIDDQTKLNISQVKVKRKIQIEKENVRKKIFKRKLRKNKTNRIATSILEGEFTWTGEEWCLSANKIVPPTQQTVRQLQKVIKTKSPNKVKKQPPPKLCDLCGEVFKDQDKLSVHKKIVHFKNPVKCPKCPRFCASAYYLKRHMMRKHENEKPFICATCGKGFAFKGELTSHYRNVHNKNLKPKKIFACKICNKTYKCSKSVIVHERSVHTGDRPAVCSVCGTSFFHEDYLKEHMRLHTGETPFKCPICGRGYAQRCNMKSHLRIHRASELDAATLTEEQEVRRTSGIKTAIRRALLCRVPNRDEHQLRG